MELARRKIKARSLEGAVSQYDFEQEPLVWDGKSWQPMHEGQRRVWESPRRFVAIFSGWRSGKTEAGPPWLVREMQRQGPGDYAVIAPTYPILDNKARPALKRFLNRTLGPGAYHSSGDIWTITEYGCRRLFGYVPEIETRILFRHGSNADAIEAFDGKGIWADEPGQMEDELHTAMEARVSIGSYRILYTSRPFKFNWYVTKIWNTVMDASHNRRIDAPEDTEVVNFPSTANPSFPEQEFERQRRRLPSWLFDLKFRGIPTKPAGVIYGCFDRKTCPTRVPLRDEWQRAAGHDFGKIHMAGLWAFRHPTKTTAEGRPVWVVYSSYLQGDVPIAKHVERFLYGYNPTLEEEEPSKRPPDMWRCAKKRTAEGEFVPVEPWAWGGNLTSEDGWREAFTMAGYSIMEPPEGAVDKGIETVFSMIATGEIEFFSDLTNLLDDLESYAFEVDEEGNIVLDASGRPKIEDKSKWHRMDSLRALCVGLSGGASLPVVFKHGKKEVAPDERDDIDDPGPEINLRELYHEGRYGASRMGHAAPKARGGQVAREQRPKTRRV